MRSLGGLLAILVLVAGCGGPNTSKANATHKPLVVGTPTYLTPAPTAPTPSPDPSSSARTASGGRTAITCRIPVSAYQPGSGGFVNMPSGQFASDPASNVALDWSGAPPVATDPRQGPYGPGARPQNFGLAYDRAVGRWLPVQVSWVAPDGQSYAYPDVLGGGVRIVKVADNSVSTVGSGSTWNVIDMEAEGVYATRSQMQGPLVPGLWLLAAGQDPVQVTDAGYWQWVTTGYAYGFDAPSVPQGAPHPLLRLNLRDRTTTTWFQRGNQIQWIAGFDRDGAPIAVLAPPAYYNGVSIQTVLINRPDETVTLLTAEQGAQFPVLRDARGFWMEAGGLYLNSVGYGSEQVSDVNGQLGGTCG
jgi:hypothetical protein